jgi:hypothetical protein
VETVVERVASMGDGGQEPGGQPPKQHGRIGDEGDGEHEAAPGARPRPEAPAGFRWRPQLGEVVDDEVEGADDEREEDRPEEDQLPTSP